jgi:hypothetical protein
MASWTPRAAPTVAWRRSGCVQLDMMNIYIHKRPCTKEKLGCYEDARYEVWPLVGFFDFVTYLL